MHKSATAVTIEQYLATGYRPDVEYLDGELKERGVVSPAHGRVQSILGFWFGLHEDEWGIQAMVEARTKVSERAVRLPDLTVIAAGPLPRRALVEAPLLVIEVLSESDSYVDVNARAADLHAMGVADIWLIDPEKRAAERWMHGAWQRMEGTHLTIADSPIYLDLAWVWRRLGSQV